MMSWPIESKVFVSVALLASIALGWAPDLIPYSFQLALLAIGVIFLGLPHGALDPAIAKHAGLMKTKRSRVQFNLAYAGMVVLIIALWAWLPITMLASFLLISAWHFSGDWRESLPVGAKWITGSALLLLPIVFHPAEVAQLFSILSGPQAAAWAWKATSIQWLVPSALLAIAATAAYKAHWATAAELGVLIPIGILTPPLVFFILYFCLLHSPRHLREHFQKASKADHKKLWRMLVVYTLATLALLAPLLWIWSHWSLSETVVRLVFIGLAAVTFPHMMLVLYAESKTESTQC